MTIESTNDNTPTTPAITYSECYAQVFSRLFLGDCLIESDKIKNGSVDLILTDLPYGNMKGLNYKVFNNPSKDNGGLKWDNVLPTNKVMEVANRIITPTSAELLEGLKNIGRIEDYIRD